MTKTILDNTDCRCNIGHLLTVDKEGNEYDFTQVTVTQAEVLVAYIWADESCCSDTLKQGLSGFKDVWTTDISRAVFTCVAKRFCSRSQHCLTISGIKGEVEDAIYGAWSWISSTMERTDNFDRQKIWWDLLAIGTMAILLPDAVRALGFHEIDGCIKGK
jgi:hypothetical protein